MSLNRVEDFFIADVGEDSGRFGSQRFMRRPIRPGAARG
jgi:hypothetical protein